MSEVIERELGWDDEIEKDGPEFVLLPEGDYSFEVVGFERARHNGSEKLPACNKAVLTIRLTSDDGEKSTTIKHNLFLHSKTEGMLCAFFTAIGQRKKGEKINMNWNLVIGSKGRCKVDIHSWKNDKGEINQSNQIKQFYEPTPETASGWKPGQF